MRYIILAIFIIFPLYANAQEYTFDNIEFISCYDADTCKFNIIDVHPLLGYRMSIRVYGIDTPELKTKDKCEKRLAEEARDFVNNELSNANHITLKNCIKGKYFRLVCSILYDGKNLKYELLRRKYGYPYFGDTKRDIDWCNYN